MISLIKLSKIATLLDEKGLFSLADEIDDIIISIAKEKGSEFLLRVTITNSSNQILLKKDGFKLGVLEAIRNTGPINLADDLWLQKSKQQAEGLIKDALGVIPPGNFLKPEHNTSGPMESLNYIFVLTDSGNPKTERAINKADMIWHSNEQMMEELDRLNTNTVSLVEEDRYLSSFLMEGKMSYNENNFMYSMPKPEQVRKIIELKLAEGKKLTLWEANFLKKEILEKYGVDKGVSLAVKHIDDRGTHRVMTPNEIKKYIQLGEIKAVKFRAGHKYQIRHKDGGNEYNISVAFDDMTKMHVITAFVIEPRNRPSAYYGDVYDPRRGTAHT